MKPKKSPHALAIIAVIIGNAIWGLTFLFTKISLNAAASVLGEKSGTMLLLAVRFIFATAGMLIMYAVRRPIFVRVSRVPKRAPHKALLTLLAAAGFGLLYFFSETAALERTTSCYTGAALAIVPVFSIVPSFFLLHEVPTRRQVLTILIPILGVILLTVDGSSMGIVSLPGILLILATCFISAFYKIFNRLSSADYSPTTRNFAACIVKVAVFIPLAFLQYDFKTEILPLIQMPAFLLPIAALSVLSSILADILVNYAAGKMTVMECASYGAVSTLFSSVAGIVVLKEPMGALSWVGVALITGGIWLLTKLFTDNKEVSK